MKRILITGASGFIGSFIVEEALRRNFHVVAAVRKSSSLRFLKDNRIEFIFLDFYDKKDLTAKLNNQARFDYIIHNAGVVKAVKPSLFYDFNVKASVNLIEALFETNKIPEKYIYISSIAAYGQGNPNGKAISNTDKQKPFTDYGKSKFKAEEYLRSLENFPWIIINPTGVYGPREEHFLMMIKLINNHLKISIGRNKQFLSFVYVLDLVSAIFLALESTFANKQYLISDGKHYNSDSFSEITKKILTKSTININLPFWMVKLIATISMWYSKISNSPSIITHDKIKELQAVNWLCDISPAQKELGYNPQYDLENGLNKTIKWYKEHKML